MRRFPFMVPAVTLSLVALGGCSRQDRIARHEQAARDDVREGRTELSEGRKNAGEELGAAQRNADEDYQKAAEEERKADEERAELRRERVNVAGRDDRITGGQRTIGDERTFRSLYEPVV